MITLDIPPGNFRAFIFDCDGTLADTMPLHHQAYLDILRPMGFDFPEELFYSLGGIPAAGVLEILNERFGWTIPAEETAERKEARFAELIPLVKPITPVVDFMLGVVGRFPVAVASGGMKSLVLATLDALGIHAHFQAVVTYEDVVHPKPAPDTYLEAARRLGVEPSACLVFEDTPARHRSGHGGRDAERAGSQRPGRGAHGLSKNAFKGWRFPWGALEWPSLCMWKSSSASPTGPSTRKKNVFLHRIFDLPFAPFEGLKVIQGDWQEEVDSVEWDVDEQFFTCWTENDETYLGQFVDEETLRTLVAEYVTNGWEESPHDQDPRPVTGVKKMQATGKRDAPVTS